MSKITFRADDDLVERLEACEASKSEVMREALRTHLDATSDADDPVDDALSERIDDLIGERFSDLVDERIEAALADRSRRAAPGPASPESTPGEITVNVSLDAPGADESDARVARETSANADPRKTPPDPSVQTHENVCGGCGEAVPDEHVYCPNCGEKQSHRAFCECGDEVRTDWAFCPGCGRRTPAADVLNDRQDT